MSGFILCYVILATLTTTKRPAARRRTAHPRSCRMRPASREEGPMTARKIALLDTRSSSCSLRYDPPTGVPGIDQHGDAIPQRADGKA